jgi:phenylalanyl-tRNA synthetase beta chain
METGLESVAYNLNRKNNNLFLFEFGNSYSTSNVGEYSQKQHLCLYVSGNKNDTGWKAKALKADFYFLKGICKNIFTACGLNKLDFTISKNNNFEYGLSAFIGNEIIAEIGIINKHTLQNFSIRQEVIYANIFWDKIENLSKNLKISYTEIPKFPAVYRDLSIVINKHTTYSEVENVIIGLNIDKLIDIKLFDVFESEKLGIDKKALAISFTFLDNEKTLTDKETDALMNKIVVSFERRLNAEIRK